MRICRIGKRLSVHEVPSVVACCRPYCRATVDTPVAALRGTEGRTHASARLTVYWVSVALPLTFGDVSVRNHKETCGLRRLPYELKIERIRGRADRRVANVSNNGGVAV
jgi:hypothetical protein